MVKQNPLTVIAIINQEKISALRFLLKGIYDEVENNKIIPFAQFTKIHFARFVIIEPAIGNGKPIPPYLVFSSNFDGHLDSHLKELFTIAGTGFDQIYENCIGYDAQGDISKRIEFFKRNSLPFPNAFYIGHRGLSVELIKEQNEVRNAIQFFLNSHPQDGLQPELIKKNILDHLKGNGVLKRSPPDIKRDSLIIPVAILVITISAISLFFGYKIVLGIFVLIVLLVFVAYLILRKKENSDPQIEVLDKNKLAEILATLQERENFNVQNQLTHIVPIKSGWFRLAMLKFVLWSINFLAKTVYNKGKLGNIPTIHFARWVTIDNNTRLLFFSNFDGSWESYLGDFIDKAAVGLTAVWSNTILFPKTKNLISKGATDEERFKYWTRMNQIPTQVWYSAYKSLSVINVLNNNEIYEGLFKEMDVEQTREWLRRL